MRAAYSLSRLFALLAALCLGWSPVAAAAPSEYAVKAAFLPKFAGYVGWPAAARPGAGAPFQLCLVGGDPFGRLVDAGARGQHIDQRPIAVRRVAGGEGVSGCHIAFVQGSSPQRTAALLDSLGGRPVLTVTDERGGSRRGMVHFVVQDGRVRFHIDEAAAARSGLAINARLLAIALSVRQKP